MPYTHFFYNLKNLINIEKKYMPVNKIWKVLELLNTTTAYFEEKQIENPRLNAEQLLGKALNRSRVDLYVSFEQPVSDKELINFRDFVKRRAAREPLQYILGETEFMGLPFSVTSDVLIPRPETEVLVEEVLKLKETYSGSQPLIVDVGSGSGCIAISLASFWNEAQVTGLDISASALQIARENAIRNQIEGQVEFMEFDMLDKWNDSLPRHIQILVSNPPYIALAEMNELQAEVRDYEPHIALNDQADGLTFYKRLFQICSAVEPPEVDYLFLEMSGSQPQRIIELAGQYNFTEIKIINDLNNIPRVLKIEVNNG